MNHYGQLAQTYMRQWRPQAYQQISDLQTHFTELGETIADRVLELKMQMAGSDPQGEGYLQKVQRLERAQMAAEEIVLEDLVYQRTKPVTPSP
ncbi:TnpV protein [Streptosporangium lutulentum]